LIGRFEDKAESFVREGRESREKEQERPRVALPFAVPFAPFASFADRFACIVRRLLI
jgi:hypothetical protein